jgi:hypothetical protein
LAKARAKDGKIGLRRWLTMRTRQAEALFALCQKHMKGLRITIHVAGCNKTVKVVKLRLESGVFINRSRADHVQIIPASQIACVEACPERKTEGRENQSSQNVSGGDT